MSFLDFINLSTLDGKITFAQISKCKKINITDQENKVFVSGEYTGKPPIDKTLKVGDVPYFLKVLKLVGDKAKFKLGDSLKVKSKYDNFVIELLNVCPNHIEDGGKTLKKILKSCKQSFTLEKEQIEKLNEILAMYKKPLLSIVKLDKNNISIGLIDSSSGYSKQVSNISLKGKRVDWEYSEDEKVNWYDGFMIGQIINGLDKVKVNYSEGVPIVITLKSKEYKISYCLSPTETV